MSVLHPVAPSAEAALHAPLGRAAREREAAALAGGPVAFASEAVGPAFETRAAALDAYAGRVEDERPGRRQPAAEDRWCELKQVLAEPPRVPPAPLRPAMTDGRRWPAPPSPPRTVWRLWVGYWKVQAAESAAELEQARRLRRAGDPKLDAAALARLARQPLRPVRPQQPLDLGLFEARLPENPAIVVPDE